MAGPPTKPGEPDPFLTAVRPSGSAISQCDSGAAVVAGREAERRDVLAFLKDRVDLLADLPRDADVVRECVDAIERGEHRKP